MSDNAAFKFGSFDYICQHAALVVCPMLGDQQGIAPTCYSRNVQLGSQIIFQPCEWSERTITEGLVSVH